MFILFHIDVQIELKGGDANGGDCNDFDNVLVKTFKKEPLSEEDMKVFTETQHLNGFVDATEQTACLPHGKELFYSIMSWCLCISSPVLSLVLYGYFCAETVVP